MNKYQKYKSSGVDWIGDIPEHWVVATVGRVSNLGRGRVISNVEIGENEGQYPVYSSQTENNGVMGKLNTYDFDGEYVTWTTDGANAGTVFHRTGKFNCTNVCGTIQPKNWNQIDLRFIPYYLNLGTRYSVRLDINPKLMNNMMAKIPLVIPPKPEQTAIADFLNEKTVQIDTLIAKKQHLIELLKQERAAVINNAVTKGVNPNVKLKPSGVEWLGDIPVHWNMKKLKYVANLNSGEGITAEDIRPDGDYPVFGGNGLRGYASKFTHEGHFILIGRQGALCGNINYAEGRFFASEHAVVVTILDRSEFVWLGELLRVMNLNQYSQASAQPGLSVEKIKNLMLPIPNKKEQIEIVQHIEDETKKIDRTISTIEKEMELMEEYRTALISEVVTGKVKVQ